MNMDFVKRNRVFEIKDVKPGDKFVFVDEYRAQYKGIYMMVNINTKDNLNLDAAIIKCDEHYFVDVETGEMYGTSIDNIKVRTCLYDDDEVPTYRAEDLGEGDVFSFLDEDGNTIHGIVISNYCDYFTDESLENEANVVYYLNLEEGYIGSIGIHETVELSLYPELVFD